MPLLLQQLAGVTSQCPALHYSISLGVRKVRTMLLSPIGFGCSEAILIIFNIVFFLNLIFASYLVYSSTLEHLCIGKQKIGSFPGDVQEGIVGRLLDHIRISSFVD
jgi:hypothetical protein